MKTLLLATILATFAYPAFCVPIPATKAVDIHGTVSSYAWIDKTRFKYEGDDLLLGGATYPARYIVVLKTKSISEKQCKTLSDLVRVNALGGGLAHPIYGVKLDTDELLVEFVSTEIEGFKIGSRIEIKSYFLKGNEFAVTEYYDQLKVDGKVISPKSEKDEEDFDPFEEQEEAEQVEDGDAGDAPE